MFRSPDKLDPTTIPPSPSPDVWDRAINNPSSLTDEEKRSVLRFPAADIIAENVRTVTGGTREELIQKAASDPHSLTFPECRLLFDFYHIMSSWDAHNLRAPDRMVSREDMERRYTARQALLSPEEWRALQGAVAVHLDKHNEWFAPINAAREEAKTKPPKWVQRIIDEQQPWGYMIYHTREAEEAGGKEEWEMYVDRYREALFESQPHGVVGGEQICGLKVMSCVEDFVVPEDEIHAIREHFRSLRNQGTLTPGVLQNVFVLITRDSIASDTPAPGRALSWAWVCESDWEHEGPDEDGYEGKVRVDWTRIYQRLYGFLSEGQFSLKDIWREVRELELKYGLPETTWVVTELDRPKWPSI
ncbi:hypothetical protein VTN00DRAFT_3299 [Thermoascus crustaceus]|uniref:uncharacterized protein n=1 Tax=Thermoascus crustaceus TaxID=5088 RepID=UPI0037439B30